MADHLRYGQGAKEVGLRLMAETDDCVEWPYSGNMQGYGKVWMAGKLRHTHSIACTYAHGPAPTPHHEVAHSCGNRRCMNYRHLRWATHQENLAEMVAAGRSTRGERNPSAKLTDQAVRSIRARRSAGERASDLAAEFGVQPRAITDICRGKTWQHVT